MLIITLYCSLSFASSEAVGQSKQPLTFADVMKFRSIVTPTISDNGDWIALSAVPDRGDSEGLVFAVNSDANHPPISVERGVAPQVSQDGIQILFKQKMSLLDEETLTKEQKKDWKPSWVLVNSQSQTKIQYSQYHDAKIDSKGQWLGLQKAFVAPKESKTENEESEDKEDAAESFLPKEEQIGGDFILKNINTDISFKIEHVIQFSFSPSGQYLAYMVANPNALLNHISLINLDKLTLGNPVTEHTQSETTTSNKATSTPAYAKIDGKAHATLFQKDYAQLGLLDWHPEQDKLVFSVTNAKTKKDKQQFDLYRWNKRRKRVDNITWNDDNWAIKSHSKIIWAAKGDYVYFGLSPEKSTPIWDKDSVTTENPNQENEQSLASKNLADKKSDKITKLYQPEHITSDADVTLWHLNDPLIKPHEKKQYTEDKKKPYWFSLAWKSRQLKPFGKIRDASIEINPHSRFHIMTDSQPYARKMLFDGFYRDYYRIDAKTGQQVLITRNNGSTQTELSPNGRFALYFEHGDYHLFDIKKNKRTNLTQALKVSFSDELNDYPRAGSAYEIIGWAEDSREAYIKDRYDIWRINLNRAKISSITRGYGRNNQLVLNPVHTNLQTPYFDKNASRWLVNGYSDSKKYDTMFQLDLKSGQLTALENESKRYKFVTKAKNSDQLIFTKEDFQQFPDLWVTNRQFEGPKQLTDINPQIANYHWGQKPELINWTSTKGKKLQGVLIKPAGYKEGDKVPVVVYFYRYMSQRMYQFNRMQINHRPNFPLYTSNGYAIFLPDIVFDIGTPGPSSTQALVPGVQKLIDMGIADPNAIGIQGHSWAGYQSAFVITQTNLFKAVVSGAPVTNMTSAYSGIRLKSGLARQFQYESGQSRIGQSLSEARELYIENSPVFFAQRINTPLLMMFGDQDGAVPWQQGIELYLALRREEKDVALLQYHGEGHHLKKYANKLDYAQKTLEYFDYHLKNKAPAPWIINGIKYTDKEGR
jgi:dipeptidyl aminopeptidase/acylaminoacyl peptidase